MVLEVSSALYCTFSQAVSTPVGLRLRPVLLMVTRSLESDKVVLG